MSTIRFRASLILSLAALVVSVGSWTVFRPVSHDRGTCLLTTGGPTKLYYCSDGRSYLLEAGEWRDIGPLTTGPVVPK